MGRATQPYFQKQRGDNQHPTNRVLRFFVYCKRRFHDLEAIAIFTGLLVIVGALQVWTFIVTERAFLSQESIAFSPGPRPSPHQPIVISFDIRNNGHTTAFMFDANITLKWTSDSLPTRPRYVRDPQTKMLIKGPLVAGDSWRATFRAKRNNNPVIMDKPFIDNIEHGKTKVYMYGFVRYHDGFAFNLFTHTIGFCSVYNPVNDPNFGMWDTAESTTTNMAIKSASNHAIRPAPCLVLSTA